jgi:hypothetical protein
LGYTWVIKFQNFFAHSLFRFAVGDLWHTQQIIYSSSGATTSVDYIIRIQDSASQCDPSCSLQPTSCAVGGQCGDCPNTDNPCAIGKPEVITRSTGIPPTSNPSTPANGTSVSTVVGQVFSLKIVAHDSKINTAGEEVHINPTTRPAGTSVSQQVACNAASQCTCVGCNLPQVTRKIDFTNSNKPSDSNSILDTNCKFIRRAILFHSLFI